MKHLILLLSVLTGSSQVNSLTKKQIDSFGHRYDLWNKKAYPDKYLGTTGSMMDDSDEGIALRKEFVQLLKEILANLKNEKDILNIIYFFNKYSEIEYKRDYDKIDKVLLRYPPYAYKKLKPHKIKENIKLLKMTDELQIQLKNENDISKAIYLFYEYHKIWYKIDARISQNLFNFVDNSINKIEKNKNQFLKRFEDMKIIFLNSIDWLIKEEEKGIEASIYRRQNNMARIKNKN